MILLRRYLLRAVGLGIALVLTVLAAVLVSIEFAGQLDDVGQNQYDLTTALTYVLLRIPRTVFEVLPAAALIGSLLGLGNLAVHRELVVMRASGISPWQLFASVGLMGFAVAVLMALLGESLAPSLGRYAVELRTRALSEEVKTGDGSSWFEEGGRIVNLRREQDLGHGAGVLILELGPEQSVTSVAQADSAEPVDEARWKLANYCESASFTPQGATAGCTREVTRPHGLSAELLELAVVRADLLDTPELRRYIRYLRDNDVDSRRYEIAYGARLASIASVLPMTLLALPFVLGGLRSAGAGARMSIGLVIGLVYYVVGEVLAQSGEVYDFDPRLVAFGPPTLLMLVTIVALARTR